MTDLWEPSAGPDASPEDLSLDEWVGQALSAASMCWEDPAGAGEFQSEQAVRVLDGLMAHLNRVIDGVIAGTAAAVRPVDGTDLAGPAL